MDCERRSLNVGKSCSVSKRLMAVLAGGNIIMCKSQMKRCMFNFGRALQDGTLTCFNTAQWRLWITTVLTYPVVSYLSGQRLAAYTWSTLERRLTKTTNLSARLIRQQLGSDAHLSTPMNIYFREDVAQHSVHRVYKKCSRDTNYGLRCNRSTSRLRFIMRVLLTSI